MIEYVLPIVYTSQAYQSKIRQGSLSVPSCPPKWTLYFLRIKLLGRVGKKFKKLFFQAVKHSVVSVCTLYIYSKEYKMVFSFYMVWFLREKKT